MLRLDPREGRRLVVLLRQRLVIPEGFETTDGILIPMLRGKLIPLAGLGDVLLDVDTNLVVVADGKLSCGEFLGRCLHGIFERQLLVLLEDAFVTEEEPSADAQRGLRITLVGCQSVVMK
jgi:hypothetical protein